MIPVELITMAGGAVLGGLFKFMDQAQKNKAEQQKLLIERNRAEAEVDAKKKQSATESANAAAKRVGNDPFSKLTRRIFVLSMVGLGAWAMIGGIFGLDVVVPVTQETGFNFLGLIDTKKSVTEFYTFENAIVHFEWLKISILAAGSFYLGKS